jgi:sigma-E factor negative regulatory protein RseB
VQRPALPVTRHRLTSALLPLLLVAAGVAFAQQPAGTGAIPATTTVAAGERSISDWLLRMHEASRRRTYIGTFVVSSSSGNLSSARIWHACDGVQQMERVESLTGAPRSTFRRNDEVVTFLPDSKLVRTEKRESLGLFPTLLKGGENAIPEFYAAQKTGLDRVAGFDAEVVRLVPRDNLRFGYRIWSEKKTGLVVKLQTLDADGQVIEQVAFSELQLDAPVKMDKLAQMMASTEGYRVEKSEPVKTTAQAEGWLLRSPVAGFRPMSCYKRPTATGAAADGAMQWIFSDGLASVSLFVEPFDRQRHGQEGMLAMGATQTLTRRLADRGGDWWLTAVGEVPPQTLKAFAQSLERRK